MVAAALAWAALAPALALFLSPAWTRPTLMVVYLPVHLVAGAAIGAWTQRRLAGRDGERAGARIFGLALLCVVLWGLSALVVPYRGSLPPFDLGG